MAGIPIVSLDGVEKQFGAVRALGGVNLDITGVNASVWSAIMAPANPR